MRARGYWIAALLGVGLVCGGGRIAAQTADIADRSALKVCADPNNLPFSDQKKEGFENKIAELIGAALGAKSRIYLVSADHWVCRAIHYRPIAATW